MKTFVRFMTIACLAAGFVMAMAAAPVVGQSNGTETAANPPPERVTVPPLYLTDSQREQIRAAVSKEDTDVSFELKSAKSSKDFKPAVGETLPKGVTAHALPRPLIYQLPILQEFQYVKFGGTVLIVNPMTHEIVDMITLG